MQSLKGRILSTENDPDNRELLEYVLTNEGFEVVAVNDHQEVLNLAQTGGFNLFILDLSMPHKAGIDLCRKLREFDDHTPILFYSGAAYDADKQLAEESGAQSNQAKPVTPQALLAEVSRLISKA